jgi:hypothetical protein
MRAEEDGRRAAPSGLSSVRFSGGADAQLSPITLQGLAVRGCARLALAAHVAVMVAVNDHWAGCRPCTPIMLPVHCATAPEEQLVLPRRRAVAQAVIFEDLP